MYRHILDETDQAYPEEADLPKLWSPTADKLCLSSIRQNEESVGVIVGSCQHIANCLATLRNTMHDSHGKGHRPGESKPRDAEPAMNPAGTMMAFLAATWREGEAKVFGSVGRERAARGTP